MQLKRLPLDKFGELLQCLHDCEHNFRIEWIWDSYFNFGFRVPSSHVKKSSSLIEELSLIENNTNFEIVGGLIIYDYLHEYDGLDSNGQPNKMFHFCQDNGFIEYYKLYLK